MRDGSLVVIGVGLGIILGAVADACRIRIDWSGPWTDLT